MKGEIGKYLPDKLYGFVNVSFGQVFFHLGSFRPGTSQSQEKPCVDCPYDRCRSLLTPAPPVLGEQVEVTLESDRDEDAEGAPRASLVERLREPQVLRGVVSSFDYTKGYGFITCDEDESQHFLHRSEVFEGQIPVEGDRVVFYAGARDGDPRACHVHICREVRDV